MKIYVVCDLEGTAGVVDFRQQCEFNGKYFQQALRLATLELNALVEGALEGGATEIVAWPGHGAFPGGIDVELLHPECKLIMHAGDGGPTAIDSSYDAMFQYGLHGMAGAEKGVLSHSFMAFFANCWLNGIKIGEIGMNIATFGNYDIPSVFISGDKAAIEEAKALVPEIEGAIVKEGLALKETLGALAVRAAISLSPKKAQQVIREAAKRAMKKIDKIEPFRLKPPYTLRIQFIEAKYAERCLVHEGVKKIDKTTVEQTREKFSDFVF